MRRRRTKLVATAAAAVAFITLQLASPTPARCADGFPVATTPEQNVRQAMVWDGADGVLVSWLRKIDNSSRPCRLYVTKLDRTTGVRMWDHDLLVSDFANVNSAVAMASDGGRGAIVAWADANYVLFAQRVRGSGDTAWPRATRVSASPFPTIWPLAVGDEEGGAIIAWTDFHSSGSANVYAQRVNHGGALYWRPGGVMLGSTSGMEAVGGGKNEMQSDGAGGAIVTWKGTRNGLAQIYAQRISGAGAVRWAPAGVRVAPSVRTQQPGTLVATPDGGAIVAFSETETAEGSDLDLLAAGLAPDGTPRWPGGARVVGGAPRSQRNVVGLSDGLGGAFLAWDDFRPLRSGGLALPHVFAQHLDADGSPLWQQNGVHMGGAPAGGLESAAAIAADDRGGFWLTWAEMQDLVPDAIDIRAGRFLATGRPADGMPRGGFTICDEAGNQSAPFIVSLGGSQVMLDWVDERDGSGDIDLYAWVNPTPRVVSPLAKSGHQRLPSLVPRMRAGGLEVEFEVTEPGSVTLTVCDLQGRAVRRTSIEAGPGRHTFAIARDGLPGAGIYFLRMDQRGQSVTRKVLIVR
ncbi:MAG: T9SS type A sorting domain-containing protein [Candidatus Eisenbacteria bacterium]|nr:T9SS type A sorting domain-containing protein [Candidatus Eisenbacteria bacterium]